MRRSLVHVLAAVSLAAGGIAVGSQFVSGADGDVEAVFIPITPCRLIDTRPADNNVGPRSEPIGEATPVLFNASEGSDSDSVCAIPNTATAIATNVTAIGPTARSYLTLYPGDVSNPGTANLNYVAGQAPTPNSANIPLAADGSFNVFNFAGSVNITVDVNGYYQPSAGIGAAGPKGDTGATGPAGEDAESPARVVWVADDGTGDFSSLSAALASITDATPAKPYVIRVAPGVYTESAPVELKGNVDVEGSGQGITTITCPCAGPEVETASATIAAGGGVDAEIRHVTIENTGGGEYGLGFFAVGGSGSIALLDVTVTADGAVNNRAVQIDSGSVTMNHVTAIGTGGDYARGAQVTDSALVTMNDVTLIASGGLANYGLDNWADSSVTVQDSSITGETYSLRNNLSASTKVAGTMLDGGLGGTGFTCIGAYTAAYVELGTNCA